MQPNLGKTRAADPPRTRTMFKAELPQVSDRRRKERRFPGGTFPPPHLRFASALFYADHIKDAVAPAPFTVKEKATPRFEGPGESSGSMSPL
jgi:hypothetical protein